MTRAEALALHWREQAGGDVETLCRLLEPAIRVCEYYDPAGGEAGLCCYLPNGRVDLWVPSRAPTVLCHEYAHALMHVGWGEVLRREGVPRWRIQVGREEREASEFAQVFLNGKR